MLLVLGDVAAGMNYLHLMIQLIQPQLACLSRSQVHVLSVLGDVAAGINYLQKKFILFTTCACATAIVPALCVLQADVLLVLADVLLG